MIFVQKSDLDFDNSFSVLYFFCADFLPHLLKIIHIDKKVRKEIEFFFEINAFFDVFMPHVS